MALRTLVPSDAGATARDKINEGLRRTDQAADTAEQAFRANADTARVVTQKADRSEIARLDAAVQARRFDPTRSLTRPGDGVSAFSLVAASSAVGGPVEVLPALPDSMATFGDDGWVVRLSAPGVVAMRERVPVEANRVYRVRFVVRRRANSADPSNDTVRCAVAWLDQAGGYRSSTVVNDLTALNVGDGRREVVAGMARAAGSDIVVVAPAEARYARAYVQSFSSTGLTDVEVIEIGDVTDATLLPPLAADAVARIGALESRDPNGARLAYLESTVANPLNMRFATQSDAQAAVIPASVTTLTLAGSGAVGDGLGRDYKRAASDPGAGAGFQTADGAYWTRVEALYAPAIADMRRRDLSRRFADRVSILDYEGVHDDGIGNSSYAFERACAAINRDSRVIAVPALTFSVENDVIVIGNGSNTAGSTRHGGGFKGECATPNVPDKGTRILARSPGTSLMTIAGITSGITWKDILLDCDGKSAIGINGFSFLNSNIDAYVRQFRNAGFAFRCRTGPINSVGWCADNDIRMHITSSVLGPYGVGLLVDGYYGGPEANYDPHGNTFPKGLVQVFGRTDAPVYAAQLRFCDSNEFFGVDFSVAGPQHIDSAEVLLDGGSRAFYPQNNFFYGCSVKRFRVVGKIDTHYIVNAPTKDGEEVPNHPKLLGHTDAGQFFGRMKLPVTEANARVQKNVPASEWFAPGGLRGYRVFANMGDSVNYGINLEYTEDGGNSWKVIMYFNEEGRMAHTPIVAVNDADAAAKGLRIGQSYFNGDFLTVRQE